MSTHRTKSLPPSPNVRTCADIAAIGVHPSVVAALLEYKQALKVYDTTIKNKEGDITAGRTTQNNSASTDTTVGTNASATTPTPDNEAALVAHTSITAIRNRLLLDITADYVCENAFRRLFIDHKTYPLVMEATDNGTTPTASSVSLIPTAKKTEDYNSTENSEPSSPTRTVRPPCDPIVKGPKNKKEFITINTANPSLDLAIDDMLWIVDNRKAPTTHVRALTAWQDHYKSTDGNSGAAMPPPPPPKSSSSEVTASSPSPANSGRNQQPTSSSTSSTQNSNTNTQKGPNTNVHTISPIHPLAPSAIGVAHASQITLHRRNVVLTREYFASASAAESNYRVAIQDLVPPPPPQPPLNLSASESDNQITNSSLGSRSDNNNATVSKSNTEEEKGGFDKLFKAFSKVVDEGVSRISKSSNEHAPGHRIGGQLISEQVGLPPISWRETLVLNILTQWTYTLTIAVVKLVSVAAPHPPSGPASAPAASTTASALPAAVNKELVVVRHISKRVYAQPTKAMFHTKEHRGESGDTMDYPNIYFNIDDFEDEDLFKDIKLCEGYTFAVLLTAGATRNSNATIFRGALSYEIIMERIKRNAARNGGKGLPVSGINQTDAFSGKTGSSFVMGTEYLFGINNKNASASSGSMTDLFIPRMFIPLVGPERRGRAELAVSISEVDIMLSQQSRRSTLTAINNGSQLSQSATEPSTPPAGYGLGSTNSPSGSRTSSFRDEDAGGVFSSPKPSSIVDPTSPARSENTEKSKEESSSGIFGRFLSKVKSKVSSDEQRNKSSTSHGGASPSAGATSSISEGPPVLVGNEAIQCCLTFVSVHAQHVMDVLLNTERERSRQWLTYYESPEELDKALNTAVPVK